ncbi:hypothetical protein [Rhizobium sullae]|uniref:Uncharacterized protein n=1 Tax=Rhizobium sullae TaxID=50338 RepID=A0A4R3PZJ8_RHISU|nr:hypothetical protein [Rhizobium sullae]TCU14138.1 hypothetical protein EV132_110215 [Rhizobium sullae]
MPLTRLAERAFQQALLLKGRENDEGHESITRTPMEVTDRSQNSGSEVAVLKSETLAFGRNLASAD